ncbi:amino acid ABC transporter ATP-binding protein [Vreelandella subglaciescola]|uniref:Amino acid ABC transporter ATP-binding protein, PAAT family n=1 Tax=Vreelandella subglaciescola TaxID=29571 RepID=A0A1M7GV17_9GAMM|nr:amino acid ABC transporter ATP-binding protein [Halomonas subglaciescola]SHM19717.1 amino acid ABC transporter ATP-binding protein, PAAT family [Halomonas subglaciescola]
MSESLILDVRNVTKRYDSLEVLKGITLGLNKGETKVVIGPSGSGKSTLLRCINHLTTPDSGEIYLDGEEIRDANINAMRARMGFVFQDFNLFSHLNVLDNVRICQMKVKGADKKAATHRTEQELARVGLEEKAGAYPAELSGGQQQRVSIARALAMDPVVLLFDEPTSALDPELTGEVVRVMQQLAADGMTMVVVTHEMSFARQAADEIIFMENGHIVEQGSPDAMFTSANNERTRAFLNVIADHG